MPPAILSQYQGKAYDNFKDSLKTEVTQLVYTTALKRFLTINNLTSPEQLLTIPSDTLEEMIKKHTIYLQKVVKSPNLAMIFQSALKHFCRMNKIRGIEWDLLHQFKSNIKSTKYGQDRDDAYDREQINKVLSVCNLRNRAIVLIYCSTGIRLSALPPLKLRHIQKLGDIYKFTVYENDEEYYTLCTPECTIAIDAYLQFRERYFEQLTPESPLIREEFDTVSLIRKKPKHVSSHAIQWTISQLFNKVGIREIDHVEGGFRKRKKVKLINGFRKFFKTQLLESHVESTIRKMLMGHDLKLDDAYDRPSFDFIVSEYQKAEDALTIDPANRLRKKVEKLEVEKTDIQALALELEKVKKAMKLR
jgi:integrase